MLATTIVGATLVSLIQILLYLLLARIVIDYIMMFSRSWQPRGLVLAFVDVVFRLTDPPLRFVRRFIPPLRIGQISLDIGFIVLFIGLQVVAGFVRYL